MKKLMSILLIAGLLMTAVYADGTDATAPAESDTEIALLGHGGPGGHGGHGGHGDGGECGDDCFAPQPDIEDTMVCMLAKVCNVPYALNLDYDGSEVQNNMLAIDGLDLSANGLTEKFKIGLTEGNNIDTLMFTVTFDFSEFTSTQSGAVNMYSGVTPYAKEVGTPGILDCFEHEVIAGYNPAATIGNFKFAWKGNKKVPAGKYISCAKIMVTVS